MELFLENSVFYLPILACADFAVHLILWMLARSKGPIDVSLKITPAGSDELAKCFRLFLRSVLVTCR
jgi:hypothetical protein